MALTALYVASLGFLLPLGLPLDMLVVLCIISPVLIIASSSDLVTRRLPDWCTAVVVLLAAFVAFSAGTIILNGIFAAAVLALLWATSELYFRKYGHEALGLGDVKLMAASALWLGPVSFAYMVFLAASAGIIATLLGRITSRESTNREVPFGPYLAYALFLTAALSAMPDIQDLAL
ncbi:MAG: A24 family peptidase [Paracoccaceae bacterium]